MGEDDPGILHGFYCEVGFCTGNWVVGKRGGNQGESGLPSESVIDDTSVAELVPASPQPTLAQGTPGSSTLALILSHLTAVPVVARLIIATSGFSTGIGHPRWSGSLEPSIRWCPN